MASPGSVQVPTSATSPRADRPAIVAFMNDPDSEAVLREGLTAIVADGLHVSRGNVRDAIAALGKMPTPRGLIVDITGATNPLALLTDLSQVVEPNALVMIVGDREDVAFYRQVTRMLGAAEYLYKPLVAEMVARHFGVLFQRGAQGSAQGSAASGGRMVSVTGTRGGVGATTIASNLAWQLAEAGRRHTVLLDANLHTGNTAMILGAQAGAALRAALEAPERVDELYVERATVAVHERLHLMAAEEKLTDRLLMMENAAATLTTVLRRRFNFVVADVAFADTALARDLLDVTQQRVLVLLPTLTCVRDTLRLLALPTGAQQSRRAVLVLNRAGMPGGMSRGAVENALQSKVDVCIPDLPRQLCLAEQLGEPAVKKNAVFRSAIMELVQEVAFGPGPAQQRRSRFWWNR